jgi:acyl carrier protein
MTELEQEIAGLIIEALTLDSKVESFDRDAPLYGDHYGLDSIDMLEIALVISQRYGFQIRSDDVQNEHVFASLRSLADHVAQHRTR